MTEIYNINCALWVVARDEAQKRGLDMSPICPIVPRCNGKECIFTAKETDAEKIQDLRDELAEIQNASYEGVKVTELGS
jgi:hypothetical protein